VPQSLGAIALERWRQVPRCESEAMAVANRTTYDCNKCHYQFSVTAGTIFHDSHLPLWKWFMVTALLCEAKKGMSACQIQRTVGMSYKTAWYLCHRIRKAMQEVAPQPLNGTVEIDETYVYGKPRKWRPRSTKQVVIGIRQRNGDLRLIRAKDAKTSTVREIIKANLGSHVEVIMTDESAIYPWALAQLDQKTSTTRLTIAASTRTATFTRIPWSLPSRFLSAHCWFVA